jgi:hypothetical protein
MVKISYRIGKLNPDDEFEVVETEFEPEPGEKVEMEMLPCFMIFLISLHSSRCLFSINI